MPDPRITNVGLVTVQFSEPVTGVDITDFVLSRDAGSGPFGVPLTGVVVTPLSASQYTLNLGNVTGIDGTYLLTLVAIGSQIEDMVPNGLVGDASDSWTRGEASDASGDLDVPDATGTLEIIGSGGTVIDGNGIDRIFQVQESISLILRNLTLTGGSVTGSANGGGVHNSGSLVLSGVTVSGNESEASGGGLFNTLGGALPVDESDVSSNSALDGGGLYNNDNGTVSILNSSVDNNTAENDGAGIYNDLDATIDVINSDIDGNLSLIHI